MNQIDLAGRRAVVTGGGQGIGRAIAERLLASGAAVSLWDRDQALVESVAVELSSQNRVVRHVAVDVSNAAGVEAATSATVAALGGLDILVANAGIAGPNHQVWEYPPDAWQQVLDVNLTGAFLCCRAVVPHMIRQNYGRIVNTASIAGKEGNPSASAYSASKAGVIALTKSLGKELARYNIAVNCITPAAAQTRDPRAVHASPHRLHAVEDPARTVRSGGRDRGDGGLARVAGELVHHGRGVRSERRPRDLLSSANLCSPCASFSSV